MTRRFRGTGTSRIALAGLLLTVLPGVAAAQLSDDALEAGLRRQHLQSLMLERKQADDRERQLLTDFSTRLTQARQAWEQAAATERREAERSLAAARVAWARVVDSLSTRLVVSETERQAFEREVRGIVATAEPARREALTRFADGDRVGAWPILRSLTEATVRARERAAALRAAADYRELAQLRRIMFENGEATAADVLAEYSRVVALDDEDDDAQLARARFAILVGDQRAAEQSATRVRLRNGSALAVARSEILLGDIERERNTVSAAQEHFERAISLLGSEATSSADVQLQLAIATNRMGDVLEAQGQLARARRSFDAYRELVERILAAGGADAYWRRELAIAHDRLGNLAMVQGDLKAARGSFSVALTIVDTLLSGGRWSPDVRALRVSLLLQDGRAAEATGARPVAVANYERARKEAIALRTRDTTNVSFTRLVFSASLRLSSAVADAGRLREARRYGEEALSAIASLASRDTANLAWQEDLSLANDQVAFIAESEGDLAAARTFYEDALRFAKRIAERDSLNTRRSRDMAIAYSRLGRLASMQGDLVTAESHHEATLAVMRRLAARNATSAEAKRDVAIALNRVGGLAELRSDLAKARRSFQEAVDVLEPLVASDSLNADLLREYALALRRVGTVAEAQGELATAQRLHVRSLEITERLVQLDPANVLWQRDVASALRRVGGVHEAIGDLAKARARHEQALAINRRLVQQDSMNPAFRRDFIVANNRVGSVAERQGDGEAAARAFDEAVRSGRVLVTRDSSNADWIREFATSLQRVGALALSRGEVRVAESSLRDAVSWHTRLLVRDSARGETLMDLAVAERLVAILLERTGRADSARPFAERAISRHMTLFRRDSSNVDVTRELAGSWQVVGRVARTLGDRPAAIAAFREGLRLFGLLAVEQRAAPRTQVALASLLKESAEFDAVAFPWTSVREALAAIEATAGRLAPEAEAVAAQARRHVPPT